MVFKPFMKLSFGAVVFLDPPSSAFFFGGGVEDNLNTHLLHSLLSFLDCNFRDLVTCEHCNCLKGI